MSDASTTPMATTPAPPPAPSANQPASRAGLRAWLSHYGPHLLPVALALVALAAIPFTTWASLTLAGLSLGVIVFMMAAGLGLVFGLMDVLNFAHGAFITFGAFVAASVLAALSTWTQAESWALNLAVMAACGVASAAVAGLLGYATERVIIRPVYGAHLKQILVTVGVLIVAEQVVPVIWGGVPVAVPRPAMLQGSLLLGPVAIEKYRLAALATGLVVYAAIVVVLSWTRVGLLIRAGVQNREMVEALGYRIRTVFVGVFIAGSALAGFGGAMWGMYHELVTAALGGEVLILTFIVVIIGGPGSTSGAFVAALIVGLTGNYVGYLAPKLALGSNILVMLAILMWRPTGLLPASRN
jgi:branched-chain amino acid transport system permease protein